MKAFDPDGRLEKRTVERRQLGACLRQGKAIEDQERQIVAFHEGRHMTIHWEFSAQCLNLSSPVQEKSTINERHENECYATRFFGSAAKEPSLQRKTDVICR